MILKDLNAFGWISENCIENNKQREKIINKIAEEIQEENKKILKRKWYKISYLSLQNKSKMI